MVGLVLSLGACTVVSALLVAAMHKYAQKRLIDLPNERSSHVTPTPRGGGLAIVVTFLGSIVVGSALGMVAIPLAIALVGGGALVSLVGFLDDHGGVPAAARFASHLAAFLWMFGWLGMAPAVDFGFGAVDLPLVWSAATLFYLLWFLNLFNFMDGIDGIAGVQTISMTVVAAVLLMVKTPGSSGALPSLLLAAATAGFLFWNWPPAKIFMGDVGSGFLGFVLGAIGFATVASGELTIWVWLIMGSAFVSDASITLFRRMARRERLSDAHRSHAYQRLSRHLGGHRPVTLLVLAIDLIWLAPLAWFAMRFPAAGASLTTVAWSSMFFAAWRIGAGQPGEFGSKSATA